jgi:large subunit ribosomal protein L4
MKIPVTSLEGQKKGEYEVKFPLVEGGRGTQAVHDVVVAYRANQRSGTANTKTMGEVAGTGKKPWRQKGTGRARAGSFQSPLWRGGGVVFGPKPRDFGKKVTRKTKQLALRKALTDRLNAGEILVVDELKLSSPKTKEFVQVLANLELADKSALVVAPEIEDNLRLASRNLQRVEVTTSDSLNTYQLLLHDRVVFSRGAFQKLEERLGVEGIGEQEESPESTERTEEEVSAAPKEKGAKKKPAAKVKRAKVKRAKAAKPAPKAKKTQKPRKRRK